MIGSCSIYVTVLFLYQCLQYMCFIVYLSTITCKMQRAHYALDDLFCVLNSLIILIQHTCDVSCKNYVVVHESQVPIQHV